MDTTMVLQLDGENVRMIHLLVLLLMNTLKLDGMHRLYAKLMRLRQLELLHFLLTITPLNYARYQFIYPEDNQVLGMSFNTNVGGTTVQGEIAYRPDFPLATATGDQINQ